MEWVQAVRIAQCSRLNLKVRALNSIKMVGWRPPRQGFMKLNADGARRASQGIATTGGLITDKCCIWRVGFSVNTGDTSAIGAEFWDIKVGLLHAWNRRHQKLELEVDPHMDVTLIRSKESYVSALFGLIHGIKDMLRWNWTVDTSHTYKERN